jgi:hypothetical protein
MLYESMVNCLKNVFYKILQECKQLPHLGSLFVYYDFFSIVPSAC